jgi:predicted Zn finger-like uncharacterized protein
MSLATRCPACGTVFRVVQDQLRVSDGWVRCGRCAEVFNAAEKLVDLELESLPVRAAGGPSHRDRVIEDLARVAGQALPAPVLPSAAPASAPWSGDVAAPTPTPPSLPAGLPAAGGARRVAADSGTAMAEPQGLAAAPRAARAEPDRVPVADPDSDLDADLDDPQPAGPVADLRAEPPPFVRQAERAASWRSSRRRAALAGAVLLAGGALVLQVAMAYRDLIAARWSVLRPPLALLCSVAGCRIEPPRQVDALVVDSSGLLRVDQTSTYRLSVVLRNRSAIELALPAVDLALTDAQGEVIARRVLDAAELGVGQRSLPGGGELSMSAVLAVAGRPVSGYTIEVFYP